MKFLLGLCAIILTLSLILAQETDKEKQVKVRRATRVCVQQEKVLYSVVVAYGKGDMKDDKPKSKCFLKCFAEKLELFNETTGEANRNKLVEYVEYLKPSDMPYGDFVDKCLAENKLEDDGCDYVYRCYSCFWDMIKNQPEPESIRLSFYDVLGFNEAFDEGEIIEEEVNRAVDEIKLESADETLKSAE